MDPRPPRILLVANAALFAMICAVFVLHHLGPGLYPDAMESWPDDHQWPMGTAVGIAAPSAQAIPVLGLRASR